MMPKRIFIVAGEMSGDIHGALLIEQLRRIMPDCMIEGIGGPAMQEKGLRSISDFTSLNVSGFWEVIRNYGKLSEILSHCKNALSKGTYDAFIAVDYPGFNMRLGRHARSLGIKSICYIAPQLWAWGKSRSTFVQQAYDVLLTVLPFEDEFFSGCGIDSVFVGHPLLDRPQLQKISMERNSTMVCLMPGSRKQELQHHLPILIPLADSLKAKQYSPVFCIPKHLSDLSVCKEVHRFELHHTPSKLLSEAQGGCVKMGTSTLEAALYGMPFISYYSTSFVSYLISKNKITLPWISLPNILLNRSLIPEHIQSQAKPKMMLNAMIDILEHDQIRNTQIEGFLELRSLLGGPGASERAAHVILESLNNENYQ